MSSTIFTFIRRPVFIWLTTIIWFASCSPLKTLKDDQYFLSSQTIKGSRKLSKSEFIPLFKIQPNVSFLGIYPRVAVYNLGAINYDSSKVRDKMNKNTAYFDAKIQASEGNPAKIQRFERRKERKHTKLQEQLVKGNWLMQRGERPAVYDSSSIRITGNLMQYHLLANGFFKGKVTTSLDSSGRKVAVTYTISEGPEYTIQELHYKIEDRRMDSIVKARIERSALKLGDRYLESNVVKERTRLTNNVKNHGYFDFSSAYIYFNIDTTGADPTKIKLQTVIKLPEGRASHRVYTIDSVYFISNQNYIDSSGRFDSTTYNGIHFKSNRNFHYSKKITDRKIRIHPKDYYSQLSSDRTQRNLSMLDMFRTVSIRYQQDTVTNTLTAIISTQTLRKHMVLAETGVSFSQAFVPGPFGSLTYRERNIFRGYEVFDLTLRAAITGQAAVLDPKSVLKTEEYSISAGLSYPQLFFPGLRAKKWDNYNPRTKITTGYAIVRRPEYERSTARAGLIYSLDVHRYRQVTFSPVDINLINTASISDSFFLYLKYLQSLGNNLIYGFNKSFVSNMNASYSYNDHDPLVNKKSRFVKYYIESGGTLFNIYQTETFLGLNTFKYVKLNADIRHYFPVNKSTFALRVNTGLAKPYGDNKVLPYEKYFFLGGPNSIRAWRLRRLGPGSYAPVDPETGEISYRIERPGELMLESSMEYRFKIVSFFEGALFADAGNSWMLTKDPARPGAEFKPANFIKEIAVGTGFGIRLNFSFLIVRLDIGFKAYDPAVKKFVLGNASYETSVWNIGIGYPF